jgi:hypothetical protein
MLGKAASLSPMPEEWVAMKRREEKAVDFGGASAAASAGQPIGFKELSSAVATQPAAVTSVGGVDSAV